MNDSHSAPTVVVGVDGSQAAAAAAVWAVAEAAARDIPLKLLYVVHRADLLGRPGEDVGSEADQLAAARTALADARHAAEATGTPVKIETEVVRGNPLATLIDRSRSAAMLCVGAVGMAHACHRAGSTAAALAGSARCPVAVIHHPDSLRPENTGHIVAEVDAFPGSWPDNNAVLGWAMAEARLRRAPLRVITLYDSQPDGTADDSSAPDQLTHRIGHWTRQYPDVAVESVAVHGDVAGYLADWLAQEAASIQLFVSGTRDRRSLGWADNAGGCSVLTVGGSRP